MSVQRMRRHCLLVVATSLLSMGCERHTKTPPHRAPSDAVAYDRLSEKEQKAPIQPVRAVAQDASAHTEPTVEPAAPESIAVAWGEAREGLRFRIWTDKPYYEEGEGIWLHVEFENTGAEDRVIQVNPAQPQFAKQAPLYDLTRLFLRRRREGDGEWSSTLELLPIASSMFHIAPDLMKLSSGRTYQERGRLDSGFWSGNGMAPGYVFEPGRHTVQAAYVQTGLRHPTDRRRERLAELGPLLWEGRLLSNLAAFGVVRAGRGR